MIVYLHHLLQLSQGHTRKLNSLETCQLNRKVFLARHDYIVTGILLPYEFYLLQRQLFQSFYEKHLRLFFTTQSQNKLHIKPCLFECFDQFLFLLTCTLISFDHDRPSLSRMNIGLMLYEVFDPCLIIPNENGIVVPHYIISNCLITLWLENLVNFDIVRHMLVLSQIDNQSDK